MKVQINISSKDRNFGTSTNFNVSLTQQLKRLKKISLVGVHIPYSFYIFTSLNNKISLTVGVVTENFVIPVGNYTAFQLQSTLQTVFNSGSFTGFTVIFDQNTLKYTIANPTNFDMLFGINGIASHLGFNTIVNKTGANTYTSDNVINLTNGDYINIRSSNLTSGLKQKSINNRSDSDVFYKVPILTNSGGTIFHYVEFPLEYEYNDGKSMESLDFQLLDANNNIIDLNGQDWNILLMAEL